MCLVEEIYEPPLQPEVDELVLVRHLLSYPIHLFSCLYLVVDSRGQMTRTSLLKVSALEHAAPDDHKVVEYLTGGGF